MSLFSCFAGIPEHKGKHFVFCVPANSYNGGVEPMIVLFMINPNPTSATTTITTPNREFINFPIHRVIDPYGRGVYKFYQNTFIGSGTGTNNRGIRIVSDIDIIVQASSTGYYTSDGFVVFPSASLGTRYVVASYMEDPQVVYPDSADIQGPFQYAEYSRIISLYYYGDQFQFITKLFQVYL